MSQKKLHCGFAILILLKEMLRQDFCDYHFHWSPLFLFLSPLIICLTSRFVFWNTWSSRDREVLQSKSIFKFNLVFASVLLWFSCFGCCGNFLVLQTGAITMMQQKRLKKGTIPTPKNKGKPTPVFATPRNTHCCACCDSLVLRQVYYGSQSPFFPWFSHDYSHCLFDSCGWSPGSQWCFSGPGCSNVG